MEPLNFCHPSLRPVVNCSTVCNEGYDVSNLISKELSSRRKGFMTYHTIKPPVEITFEFVCHVHISHIIIWPQVGGQKSSGFEILSKREPGTARGNKSASQYQRSGDEFIKIGYGCVQDELGIVFHSTNKCSGLIPSNFLLRALSNNQNIVQNLKTLIIRIVKTNQSSVPCIGAVEVWGRPSKYCPKVERSEAMHLWQTYHTKTLSKRTEVDARPCGSAVALVNESFQIPEDFVDSITCELMVLPLVLPSGKVVDESTLEKHRLAEAVWGRAPSDPFTGRLFTRFHKPVMDVALKARLDKFLVENADREEIRNIPRTVGRRNYSVLNISHLVDVKKESAVTNDNNTKFCVGTSSGNSITVSPSFGLKRKFENEYQNANKFDDVGLGMNSSSKRKLPETRTSRRSEGSHEDKLDDSLEVALKATLTGLPTFVHFSNNTAAALPAKRCVRCKSCEGLYQLPCNHLVCRVCLVQKTAGSERTCNECQRYFKSCDPVKYHGQEK